MLLSETVVQKWHSRNKTHYENLGYVFTNNGDEFTVNVEHLTKGSHVQVEVLCDYCKTTKYKIPYLKYYSNMNKDKVAKNACKKCEKLKIVEGFDYNNRKPRGYWFSKENRLLELRRYIEKYKTLENIYSNQEGHNLIAQFKNNNHDINEGLKEIGMYSFETKYKPKDYYSDLNNLAPVIQPIIDKYNRFPTYNEIVNETGTYFSALYTKEDISKLKKILQYEDHNNDLVDDSGFLNRSSYEFIVAQFLLGNKIPYKREQSPFPSFEGNYRSDFTFYPKNNKPIHVEVWGINRGESNTTIYNGYYKTMEYKRLLYDKYNIEIIDIYPDTFKGKYKDIQNRLIKIFDFLDGVELNHVKQEKLIPCTQMSDKELLTEIMKYSDDGVTLPTFQKLKDLKKNGLYITILKRYDSWMDFAKKFNKKTSVVSQNFWTKERIFDFFDDLINDYGYIPTKKKMNEYFQGLGYATEKFGVTNLKLEYIEERLLNKEIAVPEKEYEWIKKFYNDKGVGWAPTETQKKKARILLDKIDNYS